MLSPAPTVEKAFLPITQKTLLPLPAETTKEDTILKERPPTEETR